MCPFATLGYSFEEFRRPDGACHAKTRHLHDDWFGVNRPRAAQIGSGNHARHARGEICQAENRQRRQIYFAARQRDASLQHALLRKQKSVGTQRGFRRASSSAREADHRRRVGPARFNLAACAPVPPVHQRPRAEDESAGGEFDRDAPERWRTEAEQVGFRTADECCRRIDRATRFEIRALIRGIEEHRHQPEPKNRAQCDIKFH